MFSARFLAGLGTGLAACMLIFLAPALYFVEQNYETFLALAFDLKPALVRHLEHEIVWLRAFFVAGAVTTLGVSIFLGRRLLRNLLHPMERVEDHLRALTRGDWWTDTPKLPDADSDRGFFLTYEYFHHSLRDRAEAELIMLEKIIVDPAHREAYESWKVLIETHRARLGISVETESMDNVSLLGGPEGVSDSSASSAATGPSRRVS